MSPRGPARDSRGATPRLGLRHNAAQFSLLVVVNALVGASPGQERAVLPLLGEQEFGLSSYTAALSFILVFGLAKAAFNYLAGSWSDRFGRKPVLVAGWLLAVPVPLLLIWAPTWGWVVAANLLLGASQGLTWSTTVVMKIDLVGPDRRGLAMGLNEAAGYGAVALAAMATGLLAEQHGLRPAPFLLGLAFAVVGLGLSVALVRETHAHVHLEAAQHPTVGAERDLTDREVALRTSLTDRDLSAVSQAGLVNNLNDGLAWGLFPVFFAAAGLSVGQVGLLVAVYPAVWGAGQLVTGALSDRWGRKPFIVGGMFLQAAALGAVAVAESMGPWVVASIALGLGTAMVYPTLLAAVGDVAHPSWRARAVGVYRLWRDAGFAVGAVVAGLVADAFGVPAAIGVVAALTAVSGAVVLLRMSETHRPAGLHSTGTQPGRR
jgi:MFS family permease